MPLFHYQAESADGQIVSGQIEAADEAAARAILQERRLSVTELQWCLDASDEVKLQETQLTTLVQAVTSAAKVRVPLEVTLAALADEKDDPRLSRVAARLAVRLQRGDTIDQALTDMDRELPAEIRGLLRAGIESGDLAGAFERFAQQKLSQQRVRRHIRATVAYPLLILAILVPLALFLCLVVIPMFRDIFAEFQLDLPKVTQLVIQLSRQLPALIGGLALCLVVTPIVLRWVGGRWLFHRVRAALPMFGRLWTAAGQREFAAQLAAFLDLRLPLDSAVTYTGEVLSDRNIARACRSVAARLKSGQSLSDALARSMHFDRSLAALAAWGESHGLLPDALRVAADVFDDQVEQQASFVRRLLPPITLVAVATVMLFVIIGLMVPLLSLIEGLSQ
jgi:type II secretory pathway component PulF